jgi:integration host factor subunit beta
VTKAQLVERMSSRYADLKKTDIEQIVDTVLDGIAGTLSIAGRVELRGFGVFGVKHRDARLARNPRTGEIVAVTEKNFITFRAGRGLRNILNSAP